MLIFPSLCKSIEVKEHEYINSKGTKVHVNRYSRNSNTIPKTVKENVKSGLRALRKVISTKKTASHAMYRKDIGWIDFEWGNEGKAPSKSGKRKGAFGISHIIEARQRKDGLTQDQTKALLYQLIATIAVGKIVRQMENNNRYNYVIGYKDYEAVIVKNEKAWLLTGWKKITR